MKQKPAQNSIDAKEEDFKIVTRILEGKINDYRILQKKYKRIITSLIRKMIKDEDDVKDLVQESFIKAYKSLPSFQYGYSFSSWLYKIASNTCIDFLRKKRFKTVSLSQQIDNSDEETNFDIPDNAVLPDIRIINDEKRRILNEAIENLPDNYREIIKLRHEEELDYQEIAEKLSIPLGTVKAHLFRARKILFTHLKKYSVFLLT